MHYWKSPPYFSLVHGRRTLIWWCPIHQCFLTIRAPEREFAYWGRNEQVSSFHCDQTKMRFNSCPTAFKTKHWRPLYESYILDIKTLRKFSNAEPWGVDSSKPAEIGLSLLPPVDVGLDRDTIGTLPKTLDAASEFKGLETHWIRIIERERCEKNRERHRYGKQHYVQSDHVEDKISTIIKLFQTSNNAALILTGFAAGFEFKVLSSFYPNLLSFGYFTHWLDLQNVASGIADGPLLPSLRETLVACGFGGHSKDVQSVLSQHNAATDTVRAAAILIQFLGFPSDGKRYQIGCSSQSKQKYYRRRNIPATPEEKRYWKGARPRPKEFFPFITRVSRTTGLADFTEKSLDNLFSDYNPTAVGISNAKRYGWICLPDLETLEIFVSSVHGWEDEEEIVWSVISDSNPTAVPARDWEELRLNQEEMLQSKANEKLEQRRLKKESQDDVYDLRDLELPVKCSDGRSHDLYGE
ncbi:hypothetical protein V8C42DRAFT_322844 [Trichoderma barbatum]